MSFHILLATTLRTFLVHYLSRSFCAFSHSRLLPSAILLSCPVLSCPAFSCPVLSCPVVTSPVLSCPVFSCPVLSCPVMSCHVMSCPVLSFLSLFLSFSLLHTVLPMSFPPFLPPLSSIFPSPYFSIFIPYYIFLFPFSTYISLLFLATSSVSLNHYSPRFIIFTPLFYRLFPFFPPVHTCYLPPFYTSRLQLWFLFFSIPILFLMSHLFLYSYFITVLVYILNLTLSVVYLSIKSP